VHEIKGVAARALIADQIAKHNRRLVSYCRRALAKEEKREGLLLSKLSLKSIRHLVISRFPVITDDERIVAWNAFDRSVAFRS
jgi:hypothetical protein